jgi:hypothetical protein
MIEAQIAYALDAIETMARRNLQSVEVRAEAQDAYNANLQRQMGHTVWTSGCSSWYLDANGKNAALWPDFTFIFRRKTRRFDSENYILTHRDSFSAASAPHAAPEWPPRSDA